MQYSISHLPFTRYKLSATKIKTTGYAQHGVCRGDFVFPAVLGLLVQSHISVLSHTVSAGTVPQLREPVWQISNPDYVQVWVWTEHEARLLVFVWCRNFPSQTIMDRLHNFCICCSLSLLLQKSSAFGLLRVAILVLTVEGLALSESSWGKNRLLEKTVTVPRPHELKVSLRKRVRQHSGPQTQTIKRRESVLCCSTQ